MEGDGRGWKGKGVEGLDVEASLAPSSPCSFILHMSCTSCGMTAFWEVMYLKGRVRRREKV